MHTQHAHIHTSKIILKGFVKLLVCILHLKIRQLWTSYFKSLQICLHYCCITYYTKN